MLAHPLAATLSRHGIAIVDGALATELERAGADLHDPLWSARVLLDEPQRIRAVHDAYFAAGADIGITATYQATFEGLARRGFAHAAAEHLMRAAVQIALDARDGFVASRTSDAENLRPVVAASVGPYGAFLADGSEYRGDYALDEDALVAWHRERFHLLAASGADLLACETIPCGAEARAYLRLLDELPDARAWISFSARDGGHISNGERFADLAAECGRHAQVVAVGINCTAPEYVAALVRSARAVTDTPIIVYPNSGETYVAGEQRWTGAADCSAFVDGAQAWIAAGATLVGGCCRTTPAEIAALHTWRRSRSS